MNCKQFSIHVEAYVDGTVRENLRCLMDTHRDECPVCARLARAHELVLSSLAITEPVKAPPGLRERILSAAQQEKVIEQPFLLSWRFFVIEVAAFAGLALIGFIAFNNAISRSIFFLTDVIQKLQTRVTGFDSSALDVLVKIDSSGVKEQIFSFLNEGISLFIEPIAIPYLSLSLPPYYLAAMAILIWNVWLYFESPLMPSKVAQPRLQK